MGKLRGDGWRSQQRAHRTAVRGRVPQSRRGDGITVTSSSAAQTLLLLVTPLPIAALLLTPDQPQWVLGVELIGLAGVVALLLIVVGRAKRHQSPTVNSRLARILDRRSPNLVTSVLLATAGITCAVGVGGGLYWLVPTVLAALLGGAVNAWTFLIEPT
jgi:hypothetical protein